MILALLATLVAQDPAVALQEARAAQSAFERRRRFLLPQTTASVGQRCDETIGRFCYWYDPEESPPPEEGAPIAGARAALLLQLASAAERAPGNEWILGQRVRYLVEAARFEDAEVLTGACADTAVWCAALLGLARHRAGQIAGADSAFGRALAMAGPEERCQWLDVGELLQGREARDWRGLSCEARVPWAERWLELGRPLLAQTGNVVRTEFLARQAMVRILAGTATPYGNRFDAAQREMLLRYGWPVGWSQLPRSGMGMEPQVVGHDRVPAWGLLPDRVVDPVWDLAAARPRSRFPPAGLGALPGLVQAQVARLPRPGGTLLLVAWRLAATDSLNTPGTTGVLAVKQPGRAPEVVARFEEGRSGAAIVATAGGFDVAGLELLGPDGASWSRHRAVWAAPLGDGSPVLSDLVLFQAGGEVPDRLEDVLPLALTGASIPRGGSVGVYWEWSSLPAGDAPVTIQIRVSGADGGRAPLSWSWAPGGSARPAGHGSMVLDLGRLGRGRYDIEVRLEAGSRLLRSRRALTIH